MTLNYFRLLIKDWVKNWKKHHEIGFFLFCVKGFCEYFYQVKSFDIARGKVNLDQLTCEQFLQRFEISRVFLRAKQVEEKRGKFQNIEEIVHKAVFLNFRSL